MQFDRITFHRDVTQCLGSVTPKPWYMAVAAPSVSPYPSQTDLKVFRIPPSVFIKMDCSTWHAGPLFTGDDFMDFYNLELSDTNVVDHNTHVYSGAAFEILDE